MSRSTSPMGLPSEAIDFLKANVKTKENRFNNGYGECLTILPISRKIGDYGMFDECELREYELKNGDLAREFIQFEYWDSGTIIFLGLRIGEKEFLWGQEYIDDYILNN